MEWSRGVVWTCLLGAGVILAFSITTSNTLPQPPRLIGCVFQNRANVTCRWEPGDTPVTHYTLEVDKMPSGHTAETPKSPLIIFTCTTSNTSCTAIMDSTVRSDFCVRITAHSHSGDISSTPRCQSGRTEVMLPPVPLNSVKPVDGRPQYLNVTWIRIRTVFPLSDSDVKAGYLISQIQFTAQGQFDVQVKDVTVKDYSFLVGPLRPDTSYTIRLRHRFEGPPSPWSPWSNARQGRTGEGAPSAAPAFWRRVKQTDEDGWRLVSLLWKPLPRFLANGRVLFFNVTCQTEGTRVLKDHGSCRDLHDTSTSCSLRLPAGRCSCALTESTSGGTSPEARIWLLGASETEPPPPRQITATPLDDSSLDVRWTAPVDRSASGFVVEWFAVREENTSVLHWETLNSSCTALVITEGVKPMECYVVSVKALYGERGVGQNGTVQRYTRQDVPSAGPEVRVQQISGSTVELIWSRVPVEQLHGFIRNYTVSYSTANQPARRVFVPGHAQQYSLKNLLPGHYNIFMQANTDAGAGAAGPIANVYISEDNEESSILMYALLPLLLTSLALVLMFCLAHSKMGKRKLCQDVPDPSKSSLAHWTPKITLESMKRPAMADTTDIKYSEVILLGLNELQDSNSDQLQDSNPDQDLTYQSVCNLQTYPTQHYSPIPVSGAQIPQNTRKPERSIKSSTRAKTTSDTDLSSCPKILVSQTLKSLTTPLLSSPYLQFNDWQQSTASVNDVKLQLGGDSEPSVSLQGRSATRSPLELKTLPHFLRRHQSPVSDFSRISHSSVLLSQPAEVTSPQHPFSQSLYNSVPSLRSYTFTRSGALSDTFTTSLSPFPHSLFVDLSYCPVECDPYISDTV